jgi:nicotinamidase/pyrazinamidase
LPVEIDKHTALVVVDVQKDFCPGGALAVHEGDRVVPVLNKYIEKFRKADSPIIYTRDWHPSSHSSFRDQGGPWPQHCIRNTQGAKFHPDLAKPRPEEIVSKADKKDEAYSFFQGTELAGKLRQRGIRRLLVGGLATDYCVRASVLDARRHRVEVCVLSDAIRGVELKSGDVERALRDMERAGARSATFEDVARRLRAATR